MFCAPRRQYRAAAAVLSHLAARDIMEPALKATVLCVPGSRGEGEVGKEVGVEEEMEEEKEEEMGVEDSSTGEGVQIPNTCKIVYF